MVKVKLTPFTCPACGDGTQISLEIEKKKITQARRHPALFTFRCKKDHSLVVFVDLNFKIRDVEVATDATVKTVK
ncbi:MAG: hypothetical protein ACFFF9_05720 [Candidatus Thorarchaeota archaeon]